VEETITNNFRLEIQYDEFISNHVDGFKNALALVYGTIAARITLSVHATGASTDISTHRRRMLSSDAAANSGMTIVKAEIKRWQVIQRPTIAAVNTQLTNTAYVVVKLDDNFETSTPGSTPNPTPDSTGDSMWIIFVCVGGGLLVLLVGAVVCIQHYKAAQNAQLPAGDVALDTTVPTRAETVFVPIAPYSSQNYHSLYVDPHQ